MFTENFASSCYQGCTRHDLHPCSEPGHVNFVEKRRPAMHHEDSVLRRGGRTYGDVLKGASCNAKAKSVAEIVFVKLHDRVDQVEPDNGDAAFFKVANIGDCVHAGRKIDEIVREASVGNVFQQVQLLKRTS